VTGQELRSHGAMVQGTGRGGGELGIARSVRIVGSEDARFDVTATTVWVGGKLPRASD